MADVLQQLRTGTAVEHADVERTLDLMSPDLQRSRLVWVLGRLHGFWAAAESDLDAWAERHPSFARAVDWPSRRRAGLFAADLRALGASGDPVRPGAPPPPALPRVDCTDVALGSLYVLEGSTLGGRIIDRHLAGLPRLAELRLRAFSPYGPMTGARWNEFRRATRDHVAAGGDAEVVVRAARSTFAALAAWCRG